ncbi:DUF1289 domain-containing protein [uncultured Halomonas sp.]|uniref:DUF1289 domain-containing protein n=1 Tax=uncultured Halomonas sp. TaxID=173971 RepID=UPI002608BAD2|nr:DUF1289 domain-containing protein [uncultured Halomonas sp.]
MSQHKPPAPGRPASPCIKVCRPVGDTCLGCWRTLDEIARWSRMNDAEREAVWQRLDAQARNATEETAER